jgi:P-type Ca2+ transporter type 2C
MEDLIRSVHEDVGNEEQLVQTLNALRNYLFEELRGRGEKHMDRKQCVHLIRGLFAVTPLTSASITRPQCTESAKLALHVCYLFLQDIEEVQDVFEAYEASELGEALRLERHVVCGDEEHEALAIDFIVFLSSNFPKFSAWRTYVLKDVHARVAVGFGELPKESFEVTVPRLSASDRMGPEGAYYDQSVDIVLEVFKSDPNNGLTAEEATERLLQYGPNELPAPKGTPVWRMLFRQVTDFMVLILIGAAIVSAALQDIPASIVLFLVVFVNVVIGFTQEYKAERTLAALTSLEVSEAIVLRDALQQVVPAASLVPGDIVVLEEGHQLPADLRVIEVSSLQVIESILTGEAMPIEKHTAPIEERGLGIGDRKNMAYMSTVVSKGRGRGIVVATGKQTEVGKISKALAKNVDQTTVLQTRLDRLGKVLVAIAVLLCGIVIGVGIGVGRDVTEMIKTGVSLAVSVIPEGLVMVVTVTMAIGVSRMASRHAIIRRLPAVETLGSVTTVCSDKTGTLTEGKMKAERLVVGGGRKYAFTGSGQTPVGAIVDGDTDAPLDIGGALPEGVELAMMVCALCNNSTVTKNEVGSAGYDADAGEYVVVGGPTEVAMLLATHKAGRSPAYWIEQREMTKVGEIPFDSSRKRMTSVWTVGGDADDEIAVLSKGAPEAVLLRCTSAFDGVGKRVDMAEALERIEADAAEMAAGGLRVLAMAMRNDVLDDAFMVDAEHADELEADLTFVGLVGIIDPPRESVRGAIAACKTAGVRVIMITGDHPTTARAIARDLGIIDPALSDADIDSERLVMRGREVDALSKEELEGLEHFPAVFARVSPDNKLQIVRALQARGEIAAMTGDGVNDAPAIKAAQMGVAMGIAGTDLTKQSADMVLTDDNFATIVTAIEEGRRTYDNIMKFVYYLLGCNSAECWVMLVAVCVPSAPIPFTAIQILWANIIADVPGSIALGVDPAMRNVLRRKPRDPNSQVFTWKTILIVLFHSWLMSLITLAFFFSAFYFEDYGEKRSQQLAWTCLTVIQIVHVINSRSLTNTIFSREMLDNKWVLAAATVPLALVAAAMYTPVISDVLGQYPLEALDWAKCFGGTAIFVALIELSKVYLRRHKRQVLAANPYALFFSDF